MARTFLYRCPNTGQNVQGWSADEVADDDDTKRRTGAYGSSAHVAYASPLSPPAGPAHFTKAMPVGKIE